MFPGTSDPLGFGTGGIPQPAWDEVSSGNVPADRRFLQSAGPFTLQPGAVNTITKGVVWARATQGGNTASLGLLRGADKKAQDLFDRCFDTYDGPTAPNLTIQELDKEVILFWTNPQNSNNYNELYSEKTKSGLDPYKFQGYMVYQLKDNFVSQTDLYDVNKARLIYQCDVSDVTGQIVNYYDDPAISALVPQEMVNGENKGIIHSLKVTEDKFATGNTALVNHKTYYFAIIAYGYSKSFELDWSQTIATGVDYLPFISGRKQADGYFVHTAIPHIVTPEAGGTEAHSSYGSGPKLKRIEGQGNGGNILDLTAETVANILTSTNHFVENPVYENGAGPVAIKVIDPLNVPENDNFRFVFNAAYVKTGANAWVASDTSRWTLYNLTTGEVVKSSSTIKLANEQIINGQPTGSNNVNNYTIPKWGLSVNVLHTDDPGTATSIENGFIEATMTFADPTKKWLGAIADVDGLSAFNWIRSGTATDAAAAQFDDYAGFDDDQVYEKVLGGTWAPYRLVGKTSNPPGDPIEYIGGPAWSQFIQLSSLKNLASVDVVFTSDKTKWTRCPVLEMQEETALAVGGAQKLNRRKSPSVDKQGKKTGDAGYVASEGDFSNGFATPMGMGWFPGYAINVETGERLNMAFGEDSWLATDNGADMIWNPTSKVIGFLRNSNIWW